MSPVILIIAVITILVSLLRLKFKAFFAWLISLLCKGINQKEKEELFYPLNQLALERDDVKVLELGGGSGANFGCIWSK